MGKIADKYFKEDPWRIIEEGFDGAHALAAESVFSQANEYMGIRGYMEEGYSGEALKGSYFNGIYEKLHQEGPHYKGLVNTTEFMVNSADWLYTELSIDGETLDLAKIRFHDFKRVLDMRTGLLTRSFVWELSGGRLAEVVFERVLSMEKVENAVQRITVKPVTFNAKLEIGAGIDFSQEHKSAGENFWKDIKIEDSRDFLSLTGETLHTGQKVCSMIHVHARGLSLAGSRLEEKKGTLLFAGEVKAGETAVLVRTAENLVCRDKKSQEAFIQQMHKAEEEIREISFEEVLEGSRAWWKKVWEVSDIEIQGDEANQQGIRFCIFQMFQTCHGAVEGSNIGAKGLTGEVYNGNAFWDTETYCLPFFLFQNRESARNLLKFRYHTLPQARERAAALDCEGAFYPIATISGRECCNLWQHASLQLQASTAVSYGIWCYQHVTGDREFLLKYGMEMLVEICRMLASRGDFFHQGERYGYFCVMGPDEFQMMVNNNYYTNAMAKFTFLYTLKELERLETEETEALKEFRERLGLGQEEEKHWQEMAEKMYLPYQVENGLIEQHEGFFDLPHVDVDRIPVEEFPLYSHWSYDRIYRNDMIKQPDVLMLMLLFNQSFSEEELRRNYEYYEPRCIHESSLSPSVHSILAAQLGKQEEAYEFFKFATRMDLDNYNRNSGEGIHITSIAAAWMNIVYGFGGFRSDGALYILNPTIPASWESYRFAVELKEVVLEVKVNRDKVTLVPKGESGLTLMVYGEKVTVKNEPVVISIPGKWRLSE